MLEISANPDRYRYHDLLRAFARRVGQRDDPAAGAGEARGALARLAAHHHARVSAALGASAARSGSAVRKCPDIGEHQGVGALVSQCAKLPGRSADTTPSLDQLAELLLGYCLLADSGHATRPLGHAAKALLHAALEQGDRTAEARARLVLGRLLTEVGSAPSALAELLRARDLCTTYGLPQPLLALAHSSLAACFVQIDRPDEAVTGFSAAVSGWERVGDRRSLAAELLNLAGAFARQGRFGAANRVVDQSLTVSHELADRELEALARDALGTIAQDRGDHDQAVVHQRAALALTDPHDQRRTGRILLRLSESLRAAGHGAEVVGTAGRAVDALTLDGDHRGRGLALAALGDALAERRGGGPGPTGDLARARACWTEAHGILAQIGSPEAERLLPLLGGEHPVSRPQQRWPSWLPA